MVAWNDGCSGLVGSSCGHPVDNAQLSNRGVAIFQWLKGTLRSVWPLVAQQSIICFCLFWFVLFASCAHAHTGNAIHIPGNNFVLFHRLTGGRKPQRNVAVHQKRQRIEEDCKLQSTFNMSVIPQGYKQCVPVRNNELKQNCVSLQENSTWPL